MVGTLAAIAIPSYDNLNHSPSSYLGGFPVVTTEDLHKGLWQIMLMLCKNVKNIHILR